VSPFNSQESTIISQQGAVGADLCVCPTREKVNSKQEKQTLKKVLLLSPLSPFEILIIDLQCFIKVVKVTTACLLCNLMESFCHLLSPFLVYVLEKQTGLRP
jgi:hypothetical protein